MEIACGIDIIEIDRIKNAIDENGEHFLKKVFTDKEIEYCEKHSAAKYQHYAGRFAAKEALVKSLGVGIANGIFWNEVEILNDEYGKPFTKLYGQAKSEAEKKNIGQFSLSISHCHEYAVANVVAISSMHSEP